MGQRDSAAERIKDSGWRQGAILPYALANELLAESYVPDHLVKRVDTVSRKRKLWAFVNSIFRKLGLATTSGITIADDCLLVAISHDCDITNDSFDREPFVELLVGKLINESERDGAMEWGKNSRSLILPLSSGLFSKTLIRFDATKRFCVPRRFLAAFSPISSGLSPESIYLLAAWVAKRFVRRAFPDTFNSRIAKATAKLRSQFKTKGHLLSGIYIFVSDEELEDDYEIIIWGTLRGEDYKDLETRRAATALLNIVEEKLDNCTGIAVHESLVKSEDDFSLTDLRLMKRWDFDDLTVRDYEHGENDLPRVGS